MKELQRAARVNGKTAPEDLLDKVSLSRLFSLINISAQNNSKTIIIYIYVPYKVAISYKTFEKNQFWRVIYIMD